MAEPFLAEIRVFSFGFAPKGWAECNGQLLPINQNQALFSLLGTTYGGNGQTNFALPDLRGRVPIHVGGGHAQGERAGEMAHTLSNAELPIHPHPASAAAVNATTRETSGTVLAASNNAYAPPADLTPLHAQSLGPVGGSQPHLNMQPFLVLTVCIALQGIFPSRN